MVSIWDDKPELLQQMITLWDEGKSASQIAMALGNGISRNAIVGKVARMRNTGATFKLHSHHSSGGRRTMVLPSAGAARSKVKSAPQPLPVPTGPVEPMLRDGELITVTNAKDGDCRYAYGEPSSEGFHYCGQPTDGNCSWCERHKKIVYQPQQSRKAEAA